MSALSALERKTTVLHLYRALLKATRIAFSGDPPTLLASRSAARDQFRTSASLTPDSDAATQAIEHARGVTQILMQNVVQGRHVGDDKYKLNIHEHTERGDNDVAKNLKGTTKTLKELKRARF